MKRASKSKFSGYKPKSQPADTFGVPRLNKIDLDKLDDDQYFRFHTEMIETMKKHSNVTSKMQKEMDTYLASYEKLKAAYKMAGKLPPEFDTEEVLLQ